MRMFVWERKEATCGLRDLTAPASHVAPTLFSTPTSCRVCDGLTCHRYCLRSRTALSFMFVSHTPLPHHANFEQAAKLPNKLPR
jgi:hypothetical protein